MSSEVQFNLRIPKDLKDKVKQAAEESGRSINAEAQYRLEKSFDPDSNTIALIQALGRSMRVGVASMQSALDQIASLQAELDKKSALIDELKNQSK